jgi:hypothetical protein
MPSSLNLPLAEAFYTLCTEEQSTASIEALRNKAFAKLAAGEGKSLISSTLNGKSLSYQISTSATELFTAATYAIKRYNQGQITVIETDFSGI